MTEHLVMFGVCDCYVWPIVPYQPIGRCGRCREMLQRPFFLTRDEALAAFRFAYNRDPEPIKSREAQ